MIKALRKLPFVRAIYASDSNFVLFEVRSVCAILLWCSAPPQSHADAMNHSLTSCINYCLVVRTSSQTPCRCTDKWRIAASSFATEATSCCSTIACVRRLDPPKKTTACWSCWRKSRSSWKRTTRANSKEALVSRVRVKQYTCLTWVLQWTLQ